MAKKPYRHGGAKHTIFRVPPVKIPPALLAAVPKVGPAPRPLRRLDAPVLRKSDR